MIEARQDILYLGFISWYSRQLMKWHFKSIRMEGEHAISDAPILAISNHFSWWDGFIVQYLNQKKFGKNFYFMMLEEELKKRMFLNKCGGVFSKQTAQGIARKHKSCCLFARG